MSKLYGRLRMDPGSRRRMGIVTGQTIGGAEIKNGERVSSL